MHHAPISEETPSSFASGGAAPRSIAQRPAGFLLQVLGLAGLGLFVLAGCDTRRVERKAAAATPGAQPGAHVEFVSAPPGEEVAPWVKRKLAELKSRGRTALVYEGATWCEPCQRFHAAAHAGKLDDALGTLTFLEFDADQDAERLAMAGYMSNLIPYFAAPDPEGRASGKQIEGGVKGDGSLEELMGRLRGLVAAQP